MNPESESDPRQLTAALHVVVDHVAGRIVDRVMELLQLRLAERERTEPARQGRSTREDGSGRTLSLDLMTLRQAANYLGSVPHETLKYFCFRTRVIPLYRFGARAYVKRSDLDAFIARGGQSASPSVDEQLKASDRRAEDRRRIDQEPVADELPLAAASRRLRSLASARARGVQPAAKRVTLKSIKPPMSSPTPPAGSA